MFVGSPDKQVQSKVEAIKIPGLSEVLKFCKNFQRGHIIPLFNGGFVVERLKGQDQIGVYVFNRRGDLIEYKEEKTKEINEDLNILNKALKEAEILTVGNRELDS